MTRRSRFASALLSGALCVACIAGAARGSEVARPAPPLPTATARWVGEPQSWESLRGRVTLVFVWTFG